MDVKLDAGLPEALTEAHWKGKKEIAKALDDAGLTAQLKELAKRHGALDFEAFSAGKLASSADAQARLATAQAGLKKGAKPIVDQLRQIESGARKALAALKSDKPESKHRPAALQDIVAAAGRMAVALPVQLEAAVAAIEDRLAELVAEEETAKKKAAKDAPPDAALELSKPFLLLRKKSLEGLRIVKNTPPAQLLEKPVRYMAALGAKLSRVFLGRAVGGAQRNLLKSVMPGEKGIKFFEGDLIWEAKAHTFVGLQVPGGFGKRMQRALLEQTKGKFRVRARKLDGSGPVEDEAGTDDPDRIDDVTGEVAEKLAPGAAPKSTTERLAALAARYARLKPDLDAALALGGPKQAAIQQASEAVKRALADKKPDTAQALIGRLEDVVLMVVGEGVAADAGAADPPAGGKADDASAKPATDQEKVTEYLEIAEDYLAAIPDLREADGLRKQLATLKEGKARAVAIDQKAQRAKAFAALVAPARKLVDEAHNLAMADSAMKQATERRAEVEAELSQVTAAVLGALTTEKVRDAINGELKKLQAALGKADKLGGAGKRLTAYDALLANARALRERAETADTTEDFAGKDLEPLFAGAAKAVTGMEVGKGRKILLAELESLRDDAERYKTAGDGTALQSIVLPRLAKLARVAQAVPKVAKEVDANLAIVEQILAKLTEPAADDLRARSAALKDQRANDFPAGGSLDEIDAEDKGFAQAVRQLLADVKAAAGTQGANAGIAKLRERLDGLRQRIDKALKGPQPRFIAERQDTLRLHIQRFADFEGKSDLKSCEVLFSNIGATLDAIEPLPQLYKAARARFEAMRDGAILSIKAAVLAPPKLETLRNKALDQEGKRIERLLDTGRLAKADAALPKWEQQARTWAKAPAAYNNLRSPKAKKSVMKDLLEEAGGGEVFDAIMADLPDGTPGTVFKDAMDARFGIEVKEFDNKPVPVMGPDGKPTGAMTEARPTDLKQPQKGLKGLYKAMCMAPVKDVRYSEEVVQYDEQHRGAAYGSRIRRGLFKDKKIDTIEMYSGRAETAGNETTLGKDGNVMPFGEAIDADALPPGGGNQNVNWFNLAALHEVGHALDDARGVMKAHMGDAGWQVHSLDDIVNVAVAWFGYDPAFIRTTLSNASSTPPAAPAPEPAKLPAAGIGSKTWAERHAAFVAWAPDIRDPASPWDDAGKSKAIALNGRVYQESYAGFEWVSYRYAARSKGVRGYQFRSPAEWFAELYSAYHIGKLNPKHPAARWIEALEDESEAA